MFSLFVLTVNIPRRPFVIIRIVWTREEGLVAYFLIPSQHSSWVCDEDWLYIWESSFELGGRKHKHLNERFVSDNTKLRVFSSQSFAKVGAAFFFFARHVKGEGNKTGYSF